MALTSVLERKGEVFGSGALFVGIFNFSSAKDKDETNSRHRVSLIESFKKFRFFMKLKLISAFLNLCAEGLFKMKQGGARRVCPNASSRMTLK